MPKIPLGRQSYKRAETRLPEIVLKNYIGEASPVALENGFVLLQRAGLTAFATAGSGPIRGIAREPGCFNGDMIVVSGPTAYRVSAAGAVTSLGSIPGSDRVSIAIGPSYALIAYGTGLASTDGATISTVSFPDGAGVVSVAWLNNYFIAVRADSQRIYWSAINGITFGALDYSAASSTPDELLAVFASANELYLFGEATVEAWYPTGVAVEPFRTAKGREFQKGCAARDSIAKLDNTLFWVGSDGIVYRAGDSSPQRLSDHGIEERIRKASFSDLRAWSFAQDGHTFYALSIGTQGTYVYDVSTGIWGEFSSYGRSTWRAQLGVQGDGSNVYAGDDTSGQIWRLDLDSLVDGSDPIERTFTCGVLAEGEKFPCRSFGVTVATGTVPIGSAATLEMRFSDDGGQVWGPWDAASLGSTGEYGLEILWYRLGQIKRPGRVFQVRTTDTAPMRVSSAWINEI
jgi:hypothetical protein